MAEMPSAEQMLQDAAWLKRLATTLASNHDDADDLVQESWIAAWQRQPDASRPMRPWLAKVARDLAGMKRRSERRRSVREAIADDGHASSAAPDELLEQMRLHRVLVDLVLELDEPYRSTVIARFVEGRTSASIAHSLGIPAGTVRKRLHEALTRLRAGLDAQSGDRKRWAPAVLAFAKGGIQVAKPAKLVLVVLAALLAMSVATVVGFVVRRSPGSTGAGSGTPAAASNTLGSRSAPDRAAAVHVAVAVTDAAGPVANAIVRCAPPDGDVVTAQTAGDGTATVVLAPGEWSIAASADGHEPSAVTLVVVASRDARVAVVLGLGGRTVTGAVTDAGGGAIAGARVDAARLDANTNPTRAVAVAFTDRTGHYKLSVGGGQILVAASHPEYAPQIRHVDLGPSGATANFALVPGSVIEGIVRDQATKQPVAGAAVLATNGAAVFELGEAHEHVAISGADGTFRVAGLRPGVYQLSARDGARSTRAPVRVGLGVAEQQSGVVVFIERGATIRGKVVDETGAAVAAVTVHAGQLKETTATSNSTGEFVIEGLTPDRLMLWGTSDQYVPEGHAIVELKTSDVDGIVVHVRHGLDVTGHVEPRETCEVALAKDDSGAEDAFDRNHTTLTVDARGDFRFGPLLPGKATVTARCPNGDQGKLDVVVAANTADSVLAVAPGSSIAGRVINTAGNAVVGVTVNAERLGDDQMTMVHNGVVTSGFKAITTTDGSFEIRGLDAARYHLAVLDRGRPMKAKHGAKVELTTAQRATGIEMVVERPSGTISGTVSGPDGAPIPDAWVSLQQDGLDQMEATIDDDDRDAPHRFRGDFGGVSTDLPPALTDVRGHFEMSSVPHGRYQVVAEAQAGQVRGSVAGVIPDREIAIQLVAVSSLLGAVHGAHGPSELFSVAIEGPTSDTSSFTDGSFEFPRVDPGDYTIAVTSSDGTGSATVHVASGEAGSADITLIANATVTGRLVDKTGKPIAGMSVAIIPDQPPGTLSIALTGPPPSSGPDGRFQVDGKPGKMTLVVLGSPPTLKTGLPLEAGQTIDVGDVTVKEPQ